MKNLIIASTVFIAACGGGSGSSNSSNSVTELEGTWVYSTGSYITGSACGLDLHGNYEQRTTFTFAGSTIRGVGEDCIILQGNTGSFLQTRAFSGTFSTGDIYLTYAGENYKTLDVTSNNSTQYSGYALSNNTFKLALATAVNDGSTPAKRLTSVGTIDQPKFIKQ